MHIHTKKNYTFRLKIVFLIINEFINVHLFNIKVKNNFEHMINEDYGIRSACTSSFTEIHVRIWLKD